MQNELVTAYVGLGSNLGDRAGNLLLAARGLMEASIHVVRLSGIYETEPVGVESHDDYLNMVAEVQVAGVTPEQVLARMFRIEYLLGRRQKFTRAPRTVDLDLLLYGGLIYRTSFVTVPHPRMHERNFVLVPMVELSPHIIHPVLNQPVHEILSASPDASRVRRWNPLVIDN